MKVLDLKCAHQHVFEGWFASEDDFQSQLTRDLVQCPMCGDAAISKQLSAPRLNLGATPPPSPAAKAPAAADADVSGGVKPSSRELVPARAASALSAQDLQDLQAVQADWLKMAIMMIKTQNHSQKRSFCVNFQNQIYWCLAIPKT